MQRKLLLMLAGAVVLLALSRTRQGQSVVATVTDAIASNIRGIRNNNPGNIRRGASQWQGMRAEQTDADYVQFVRMVDGVRAACKLFRNYQSTYGLRTVRQLISRWAPAHENPTDAYAANVARRGGLGPDDSVNLGNASTAEWFLRGVFRQECGISAEAIPDSTIREGIAAA